MDQHLIELLKQAYKQEIRCYLAYIDSKVIKPFTSLKPPSKEYRDYFKKKELDIFDPITLVVYQKGPNFICSDDLNALYMFRERRDKRICCTVLGKPEGKHILAKSKSFYLPLPTIELLKSCEE